MLFIKSHRIHVQPDQAYAADPDPRTASMSAACGFRANEQYPDPAEAQFGPFAYLFPDAPVPSHDDSTTEALDRLASSMVDVAQGDQDNSDVPAIITYLGQFIDHDITAGTDREAGFSNVDTDDVTPLDRNDVAREVANLRTGALDLDSLYGGAAVQGAFAAEMTERLRHPRDRAKLRIGTDRFVAQSGPRPERPVSAEDDPAHDLLRLDRLIRDEDVMLSPETLDDLPEDLRAFLTEDGTTEPNPARAVIGDGRNDENLAVATVHLAFARLHNRIADHAPNGDADARYAWARQRTRWIYQWLLVNVYLPSICDADTLSAIIAAGAPVYRTFADSVPHKPGHMPIPLEFSVAAFRFGHSTVRAEYDWNANFGRADPEQPARLDRAGFDLMFAFTGNGRMAGTGSHLPSGWMVDAARFINTGPGRTADRNTRLIDTHIAPPLHDMPNEPAGRLKQLPLRNLRRGHLLALPSAQACLDGFEAQGIPLPRLSDNELRGGTTGTGLGEALTHQTPLWFYVLKEAEVLNGGLRLGPLGTRLIAETLVGLVWYGPDTYRAQPGSDDGVWHPRDGVKPSGEPVDSLAALMRAALLM